MCIRDSLCYGQGAVDLDKVSLDKAALELRYCNLAVAEEARVAKNAKNRDHKWEMCIRDSLMWRSAKFFCRRSSQLANIEDEREEEHT